MTVPPALEPTRRNFLVGSLLAMAGCHVDPTRAPETRAPVKPGDGELSPDDVAAAERVIGIAYTPPERQQLFDALEGQLKLLAASRAFERSESLAPACVFDPRLPGKTHGPKAASFRGSSPDPGALPGDDVDIAFAPVTSLSRLLETRKITSTRLTELYLHRLETIGPKLESVVTLTRDRALAQAARADEEIARGKRRGPLHGVPWGAKDLLDTDGIETSWGAAPYRGRVPTRDAAVVHRLDQAGAILVAKLSLGALAYGDLWFGGRTRNPWNLEEGSSGSSAGSAAAVAAGLVGFAIGTETLGSIVSPSMRCGVTGLRPTFGRVSRAGAMALCWSLDKIGPLARSIEDCALVLDAIHGHDPEDASSIEMPLAFDARSEPTNVRLAYDPAWFEGEGAVELDRRVLEVARARGFSLVERRLPDLPYDSLMLVLLAEAAAAFEPLTLTDRDDELTWQAAEAWPNTFRLARFIPAVDLVQADRLRRRVMEALDEALGDVDALISPSYAGPLLVATNFTGHPSLTLRTGFQQLPTRRDLTLSDDDPAQTAPETGPTHRVPHGITLWGRLFDEGRLCRIGMSLEAALDVMKERPRL